MVESILGRLYRRLGRHYPAAFVAVELQAGFLITIGTVVLLSFFYEGTAAEFGLIIAVTCTATALALVWGFLRINPSLRPIKVWIDGYKDPDSTARAWSAAVGLPLRVVRSELLLPVVPVILSGCISAILALDLPWTAIFPLFAASVISVGYGAILHYLTIEAGMRPVLVEINQELPPRLAIGAGALPLRFRLLATLPAINVITGLVVAAITNGGSGDAALGASVLVAIGVATTISLELTLLLSRSILAPLADLQRATDQIGTGNYEAGVAVTTADEIGGLAASFNQMVSGLRERERIREAFGTYLDEEVADYILSEGFSEEGFRARVTVLFCDVREFTAFAAEADARRVVATLNSLFEVVVPIIAAEGGHIDKFEGDGLMAIFGAPEGYSDHAERAVRAALEIDSRVNLNGSREGLRMGVGINTGDVVAGSIGGGGRLNFSVIGDAVNVAARVEGATRETGDSVLITERTRSELGPGFETESRGAHELKGLERPIELHAPRALAERSAGKQLRTQAQLQ